MSPDHRRQSRIMAVQFLYQCEAQGVFYYSESLFHTFKKYLSSDPAVTSGAMQLCKGVLSDIQQWDQVIEQNTVRWSLNRIATVDKCVLRLGAYELSQAVAPKRVVINEAVELAKLFGTEKSSGFVNGILDSICKAHGVS
ncbi:MAG: transcription antitermination factor NusB [Zetaproteobacteria bacterium]|nr:transcription antitermination factor NusB [Zetaproteobacteria bacterium]